MSKVASGSAEKRSLSSEGPQVKRRREEIPKGLSPDRPLRPAPFFYYVDRSSEPDNDPLTPIVPFGRHVNLPGKMHVILNSDDFTDIISWMSHGRAWRIHKPTEFESKIMPKFWGKCNMSSFLRQLRFWGFLRLTKGPDKGCYYHEYLLRGLPCLSKNMKRSDKQGGKEYNRVGKREYEPDLYAISKIHPIEPSKTDSHNMRMLMSALEDGPNGRLVVDKKKEIATDAVPSSSAVITDRSVQDQPMLPSREQPPPSQSLPISPQQQPQLSPNQQPQILPQLQPQLSPNQEPQILPQLQPQISPNQEPQILPQLQPQILLQTSPISPQLQPQILPQQLQNTEIGSEFGTMENMLQRQLQLSRWQAFVLSFLQMGMGEANTWSWMTGWWLQTGTTPVLSEEEEQREISRLSQHQIFNARADMVGSTPPVIEPTVEEGQVALYLLCMEIDKLPLTEKTEFVAARNQCRELIDDDLMMAFLQMERFDHRAAAKTITSYWRLRVDTLGPERVFLPLTVRNLFQGEELKNLMFGFVRVMPVTDIHGRPIVFVEPGRYHGQDYCPDAIKRSVLYTFHTVCCQLNTRRNGLVIIFNCKKNRRGSTNMKLVTHFLDVMNSFSSIIKSLHACYAGKAYQALMLPVGKFFMTPSLRLRMRLHSEEGDLLLERFKEFGLPPDRLPTEVGGEIELDHEGWINERIATES